MTTTILTDQPMDPTKIRKGYWPYSDRADLRARDITQEDITDTIDGLRACQDDAPTPRIAWLYGESIRAWQHLRDDILSQGHRLTGVDVEWAEGYCSAAVIAAADHAMEEDPATREGWRQYLQWLTA